MPRSANRGSSSASTIGENVLGMHIEDFKRGMEKFAGMFTDTHGLRVVFRGTEARTDGKTIYVPELALLERKNMTAAEIKEALDYLMLTRAFVYHEGGHVLFTDMDVWRAYSKRGKKFKQLFNALEDLRIERKDGEVYPGAKETLRSSNAFLATEIVERMAKADKPPNAYTQLLYAIMLLGGMLGPNGREHTLWTQLPIAVRHRAKQLRKQIARAVAAESTQECADIAEEIWHDLKEESEQPEPKDEQEGQQQKENGKKSEKDKSKNKKDSEKEKDKSEDEQHDARDEDESSGDGERGAPDDKESDDLGDGEDSDGESDDGGESPASTSAPSKGDGDEDGEESESESSSSGGYQEDAFGLDDDGNEDDVEDKSTLLSSEFVDRAHNASRDLYRIYSTEHDYIGPPPAPKSVEDSLSRKEFVKKLDEETRSIYGPMRRRLENILKARSQSYYVHGLDEGELDASALHRLASSRVLSNATLRQQARHVFQQRVQGLTLTDTAVLLSVDRSGSMGSGYPRKDILAMQCTDVLGSALDGVKVPFEVHTWSTKATEWYDNASQEDRRLYSRWSALDIYIIKAFEETWQFTRDRLQSIRYSRCNLDGESVWLGATRLLSRKEKRKVLFVICDGMPSGESGDDYAMEHKHLHDVVKRARALGVEVWCIGIQAPGVATFYGPDPQYKDRGGFLNINALHELPTALMARLEAVLLR